MALQIARLENDLARMARAAREKVLDLAADGAEDLRDLALRLDGLSLLFAILILGIGVLIVTAWFARLSVYAPLWVLLFAILGTIWLGTIWIRPLESLRDQALARTAGTLSTEPLEVDRDDEITVTDNTLGSMGKVITMKHEGREVKFCCKPCVRKFNANPAKYLAKLK